MDDILAAFDGLPELPAVVTLRDMKHMEETLKLSDDAEWRKRFDVI